MSSCASIIHGPSQAVKFSSDPVGAVIMIDGEEYGKTPQTIDLRRKGRKKGEKLKKIMYDVKVVLADYQPYETKITRTIDGWFFGNILLGGFIGFFIDAANGSMYQLTPDQVMAQMKSTSTSMNYTDGNKIYFAITLEADPSWVKIGQLDRKLD